jgi:uncharacterized protein YyaL (SSP411 family)
MILNNELSKEKSPYLLQHKDNPVQWQRWQKAVFDLAKLLKKPVLVSVGYASCHWCHVMQHESFEDIETANLMNEKFINVKVDREERPDVDHVMQTCHQIYTQRPGGWPLTMFLDENGVPFMAGTYFPKEAKYGMPTFKEILTKVSDIYKTEHAAILIQGPKFKGFLNMRKSLVTKQELIPHLDKIVDQLDPEKAGFVGAPKFPMLYIYNSILYFYKKTKNEKYLKALELLLNKICSQGIYDHVEGGIARYSTDDQWLVPHFEKMLYDNVQFIQILADYLTIKKDDYFLNKLDQTIQFFLKNFKLPNNLLGSALDADSDGEEGKYYVYHYEEIKNISNISDYFEISEQGNWEGKIILKEIKDKTIVPNIIIDQLKKIRQTRNKPFFDDKTQLDLNVFFVSALLKANKILPKYLDEAKTIFKAIENHFFAKNPFHSYSPTDVFIEDYSYSIQCLMDLYDETLLIDYKLKAREYATKAIELFYDREKKFFQKNKILTNDLFVPAFDIADHNIPNGNSVMLINFLRIGFLKQAKELYESMQGYVNMYSSNMASFLKAIDIYEDTISKPGCTEEGCTI